MRFAKQKGFTLVELMIALAILGILVGVAVPSMQNFFERSRIASAANTLYNDLKYVRSEAIKRDANIYIKFTPGNDWCYAYSDTTGCNCAETDAGAGDYCRADNIHYQNNYLNYDGVALNETLINDELQFTKLRGDTSITTFESPQTIALNSENYQVNIKITSEGLISICTQNEGIGSYPLCT